MFITRAISALPTQNETEDNDKVFKAGKANFSLPNSTSKIELPSDSGALDDHISDTLPNRRSNGKNLLPATLVYVHGQEPGISTRPIPDRANLVQSMIRVEGTVDVQAARDLRSVYS
jgi:hypothetical protein